MGRDNNGSELPQLNGTSVIQRIYIYIYVRFSFLYTVCVCIEYLFNEIWKWRLQFGIYQVLYSSDVPTDEQQISNLKKSESESSSKFEG